MDNESLLDPFSGPITEDEVAFDELQKATSKLIDAESKYSTATSSSFERTRATYKSRLNNALRKANRLYTVANTVIYQETARGYIALFNTKLAELKELDDSQSGGSIRRRIKSARKKSKRHKKTHHRKH